MTNMTDNQSDNQSDNDFYQNSNNNSDNNPNNISNHLSSQNSSLDNSLTNHNSNDETLNKNLNSSNEKLTNSFNKNNNTRLITLIENALSLTKISIGLGLLAVLCFIIFGTLASLSQFANHTMIYYAFHYLPYGLIGLSIPISLYHLFLLHRYRLLQFGILMMIVILAIGLFWLSTFLAFVAWFSIPYLAKVNLHRFLAFLKGEPVPERRKKRKN